MYDFFKKILSVAIIVSAINLFVSCDDNSNDDGVVTFSYDFENVNDTSIWKNVSRIVSDDAFSGNYVCQCAENQQYAFGFDMPIEDDIKKSNITVSIDMMIKSKAKLNAIFAISLERDGKTIFWNSFPLSKGFEKENQWYKNTFSLNIPNDALKNSKFNCYVMNNHKETFLIDDFNLNIKYFNIPSYLNEIEEYDVPEDLKIIFNTKSINVLYSEKERQIVLADDKNNVLTKPLSFYYSLIIDNDTVEISNSEFVDSQLSSAVNEPTEVQQYELSTLDSHQRSLSLSKCDDTNSQPLDFSVSQFLNFSVSNNNLNFYLETKFNSDVRVLKSSLIIPFLSDDFTIYRRNPFVDTCDYQDEYYLDQEGFSVNYGDKQLNIYHPDNISSIQLDVENATAHVNLDYCYDHYLIRYQLLDTLNYYIDNSSTFMKEGSSLKSSFAISLTDKMELPRIMPINDGYESAFIWTEHADWADIRTHRATYLGSEDVVDADDAIGGFVYYDIPVTKSVFYNNPDSVTNYDKNPDFPGLHSTIMTDEAYFDFLKQLKDKGFDICLHTPEQYTTTRNNLEEALSFMKENFGSPSWIDHGYNNGAENNREDMVCDGLDSTSPHYAYDLWKKYDVKYIFNSTYEEMNPRPLDSYIFDNHFMRPYPGFGDAYPLPKVGRHHSYPDMLLWTTPYTMEPGENWLWDYFFNDDRLNKIVDHRYVFITHFYAPWVTEERGYWEVENGKIVAKKGLNQALGRIAKLRDEHLMLPTTIADYMTYQEQLRNLEYRVCDDGSIMLKNNNNETIKGLSLISVKEMALQNKKSFNKRKTKSGDEWIIWFDIEPDEEVRVYNVNKN